MLLRKSTSNLTGSKKCVILNVSNKGVQQMFMYITLSRDEALETLENLKKELELQVAWNDPIVLDLPDRYSDGEQFQVMTIEQEKIAVLNAVMRRE